MKTLKQILEELDEKFPTVRRHHPTDSFITDIPSANQTEIKSFISQKIKQILEDARPTLPNITTVDAEFRDRWEITVNDYDEKVRKILGEDV